MADTDWQWMSRALALAERGRGAVEPNPLVGAVIVRGDQVVGDGWHRKYGEAHAEVDALGTAGEAARGGTLYVTLEPCCHWGKTPPCTDAVVRAGIARVVAAMADPFPPVSGLGFATLRAAGIAVESGLGEAAARRLNAPYVKLLATGRPYVRAKWAMTLDGKICTRAGDSQWISNDGVLRRTRLARGRFDAIVIGIGTALADDPLLTARPPGPRVPVRIVLDSGARLPDTSRLARTAREAPLLVVSADGLPERRRAELAGLGAEVLLLPARDGRPCLAALLDELGRRRMTNVLVEGGAAVLGSFLDADALDEVEVCVSPRLVGGIDAKTPVAGRGVAHLRDALTLSEWHTEVVDGNVLLTGRR
jgi:diaminohydroxyphosphoribosylaminopyrimidine deaminase/5-amino-6-(5-phosphoribosylamino)uracil reductase